MVLTKEQADRLAVALNMDAPRNCFSRVNNAIYDELIRKYTIDGELTMNGVWVLKFYEGALRGLYALLKAYSINYHGEEGAIEHFYQAMVDEWCKEMTIDPERDFFDLRGQLPGKMVVYKIDGGKNGNSE